jgi:hypothetical protein
MRSELSGLVLKVGHVQPFRIIVLHLLLQLFNVSSTSPADENGRPVPPIDYHVHQFIWSHGGKLYLYMTLLPRDCQ